MKRNPYWEDDAACATSAARGIDFFAEDALSAREAEAFCHVQKCPVIEECARAGRKERYGVWGGRAAKHRLREKRQERAAARQNASTPS